MKISIERFVSLYEEASGVPGWKAVVADGGRIEVTPPPGYIIVRNEGGGWGIVKAPDLSAFGFRLAEVAGPSKYDADPVEPEHQ